MTAVTLFTLAACLCYVMGIVLLCIAHHLHAEAERDRAAAASDRAAADAELIETLVAIDAWWRTVPPAVQRQILARNPALSRRFSGVVH